MATRSKRIEKDLDPVSGGPVPVGGIARVAIERQRATHKKHPSEVILGGDLPEPEDPISLKELGKGIAVETVGGVASQAAGIKAGAIVGALSGPAAIVTAPLTYAAVSFSGGFGSSVLAQRAEGRSWDEISWGRAVAGGLITAVPGGQAVRGASKVGIIAKEGARGVGYGVTEATTRAIIDEKRLPTKEEVTQLGLWGGGFGLGARGAGMSVGAGYRATKRRVSDYLGLTGDIVPGFPKILDDAPFVPGFDKVPKGTPKATQADIDWVVATADDIDRGISQDAAHFSNDLSGPGEEADAMLTVAGRLSKWKQLPFLEKNELVKRLGLNPINGERRGVASNKRADELLGRVVDDIEGEAIGLTIIEAIQAQANPISPSSLATRGKVLNTINNFLTGTFPSMVVKNPLRNKIKNIKRQGTANARLTSKVRDKIQKITLQDPASTIGIDTTRFLTGQIDTPTSAMKPIAGEARVLYEQMQQFQQVVFPFLKPNFLDKIPLDQRKWLKDIYDSHGRWLHVSYRIFDDKNYPSGPEEEKIFRQSLTNLKNFLKSSKGADWGFGDFKVVEETIKKPLPRAVRSDASLTTYTVARRGPPRIRRPKRKTPKPITRFVRSDNGKEPPAWAFSDTGKKKPLSPEALRVEKIKRIQDYTDRYLNNSAKNKATQVDKNLKGKSNIISEEDIIKHKMTNWPKEFLDFFGGPLKIPGTELVDYGSILEVGNRQLASLAVKNQVDFHVLKSLAQSGLAKRIDFVQKMPHTRIMFREGAEELRRNAEARGVLTPDAGGQGTTTINFFNNTLEVETTPRVARALDDIRFDRIAKSMSEGSTVPAAGVAKEALSLGIFASKYGLVALNFASFPTNTIGAVMATFASGNNPFRNMVTAARAGLSEFGVGPQKAEVIRDFDKAIELGVLDNSVVKGALYDNIIEGSWTKKITDNPIIKVPGSVYSSIDNAFRYTTWKGNSKMFDDIVPHLDGVDEVTRSNMVAEMAANFTNAHYPNYDNVAPVVKQASKWGVLPVFATFNAELVRNTVNLTVLPLKMQFQPEKFLLEMGMDRKFLKNVSESTKSKLRWRGLRNEASFVAVAAGSTALWLGLNDEATGFDSDMRNKLRNFVAPWNRNDDLIFFPNKDDPTKGRYVNLAYLNQYSLIPRMVGAVADLFSKDPDASDNQIKTNLMNILIDEFGGEGNFIMQSGMESLSGFDDRGNPISLSAEEASNRQDRLWYFIESTFRVAGWGDFINLLELGGFIEGTPRRDWDEMLYRSLGIRTQDYDVERSLIYEANPSSQSINNIRTNLKNIARIRQEDLKAKFGREVGIVEATLDLQNEEASMIDKRKYLTAFQDLNKDYQSHITKLIRLKDAAMDVSSGTIDEERIVSLYKQAGLSQWEIIDILRNKVGNLQVVVSDSIADKWQREKTQLINEGKPHTDEDVFDVFSYDAKVGDITYPTYTDAMNYKKKIDSSMFYKMTEVEKLLSTLQGLNKIEKLFEIYPNIKENGVLQVELRDKTIITEGDLMAIREYSPPNVGISPKH